MRIGIMCHSSVGGSGRIAIGLASELARRGHRLHLFTRNLPNRTWVDYGGAVLHTIGPSDGDQRRPTELFAEWSAFDRRKLLYEIMEVIRIEGLDVLHFHYALPFACICAEVKGRLDGAAPLLVGTLHGTDVSLYGVDRKKGPFLAKAVRDCDCLTTVSFNHARLAQMVFDLPGLPKVIPNFVNLSKYGPRGNKLKEEVATRERVNSNNRPKIVHVSNFRPVKDVCTTIRIFEKLLNRIDAELWLVGEGREMKNVKILVEHKGIESRVRFWGLRKDVDRILSRADVLLMSSVTESFCLAALEAIACGVPVIAPEVGGLPEVVVHGKTGFLFPRNNWPLAADFVFELVSNGKLYRQMAGAAVRHALRFSEREIVSTYEDLYRKGVGAKAKSSRKSQFSKEIHNGYKGSYSR